MTHSMVRSLAAAATMAAFGAAAEIRAAPGASPFAGTYRGGLPAPLVYPVTVADNGRVSASWDYGGPDYIGGRSWGSLSGRVADDGTMSLSGTSNHTTYGYYDEMVWIPTKKVTTKTPIEWEGRVSLDASGALVGVPSKGEPFTWARW